MKPPPFAYMRPATLEEAIVALSEHGDDAKVLAGGQSLVPLLNFRFARPSVLIDLGMIEGMQALRIEDDVLVVGAMVRQRSAELAPEVLEHCPILPDGLRHVGHIQIRHRGTIGGSLAHADPAAELPAIALAVDAEIVAMSIRGSRTIAASSFFEGPFMTALAPDEIVKEIRFPSTKGSKVGFLEFARRSGDFAIAGVAVINRSTRPEAADIRISAFGVGGSAVRLHEAEDVVRGRELSPERVIEAGNVAAASIDAVTDVHADAHYRSELLKTLVARTLRRVA